MRWDQKPNLSASTIDGKGFINRSRSVVYDEDTWTGKM